MNSSLHHFHGACIKDILLSGKIKYAMKRAYEFRIYPNKNQEVRLDRALDTCRHLYNDSLAKRKLQAELNRLCLAFQVFPWGKPEWISYEEQANDLSDSKTTEQKEVFSQILQDTLRRLDQNLYYQEGYRPMVCSVHG